MKIITGVKEVFGNCFISRVQVEPVQTDMYFRPGPVKVELEIMVETLQQLKDLYNKIEKSYKDKDFPAVLCTVDKEKSTTIEE
jgi:hypothetical protein